MFASKFPFAGGDGPKLIDILQMREKHLLQDRIEMLGPVRHSDVRNVSEPAKTRGDVLISLFRSSCKDQSI